MKKLKYCLLAILCPVLSFCQVKPLTIGDRLPQIEMTQTINYKSSTFKFADYKHKLLILDFWATWCGSCYKKFPHLDSLQSHFGKSVKILLVNSKPTGDDAQKINGFFKRRLNADGTPFCFTTVIEDNLLWQYFPHSVVPHYVWIFRNKIIAITDASQVNTGNLDAVLKNRPVNFQVKDDSLYQQQKHQKKHS